MLNYPHSPFEVVLCRPFFPLCSERKGFRRLEDGGETGLGGHVEKRGEWWGFTIDIFVLSRPCYVAKRIIFDHTLLFVAIADQELVLQISLRPSPTRYPLCS